MEGMARCKRCGEVMEGTVRCEVCGRRADRVHFNEKLRAQFVEYLTEDWDGNPLMDEGDIADLTADDIEAIAREVGAAARAFLADTAEAVREEEAQANEPDPDDLAKERRIRDAEENAGTGMSATA